MQDTADAPIFSNVVDFNKHASEIDYYSFGPANIAVAYYRCEGCGFLFTPFCDSWTQEDFRHRIYDESYVFVDPGYLDIRPRRMADAMTRLLTPFRTCRILDYGAGSGLFADLMNNAGFHVESYDPFSIPTRPTGQFDLITAFEVLEHSPFPADTVADMQGFLAGAGCIILGQTLQPSDIDRVRANWWYCAPRNGHVSTFADRTLAALAARFGLIYHRGHHALHVLRTAQANGLSKLAEAIGKAFTSIALGAPAQDLAQRWHPPEKSPRDRWRWTASDIVTWHIAVVGPGPATLQVRIPFVQQAKPGFAAECRVSVGDQQTTTTLKESCIVAEAQVDTGDVVVTLNTPRLIGPEDRPGGRDQRVLGLAIRVLEPSSIA